MARPKKSEEKTKEPEVAQISRDDFIRTRDSVVTGLTSLQAAVQDLARAYIDHTDTVLGRKGEGSSFAQFNLTTKPLGVEAGFFSARGATPAPAPAEPPVEGKKRKRAPHDKNAPKRALTPFFLYLQSERAHIGTQLGQSHTAKEVQDEGGKRWREMPDQEKAKWQEEYGINFARYQEHMKAYKAGEPLPTISDAEAKRLHEKNKLEKAAKPSKAAAPAAVTPAAPVENDDDDDDDDSSSDDDTPEPVKEPTPPPAKKQKTKDSAKKKAAAAKVDEPTLDPLLRGPVNPLPEKKKKSSKKEKVKEAPTAAPVAPVTKAPEPEPKPKKKGRKHKGAEAST